MHLNTILFEPNSSYIAEGWRLMPVEGEVSSQRIEIETDDAGRLRSYSDGLFDDKSLSDS